jgi:hypothetical protein
MDRSWCGIATSAHVVKHADDWRQSIRILGQEPVGVQPGSQTRQVVELPTLLSLLCRVTVARALQKHRRHRLARAVVAGAGRKFEYF